MNYFLIMAVALPLYTAKKLTDEDIVRISNLYVKPNLTEEYKNRYDRLPLEKNLNFWPWEEKDFPRVMALLEFERFVKSNKISSRKVLAINGNRDPELHYLPYDEIFVTSYDNNPIDHNLYSLNLSEKDFDFVMVNQTFEHVYDPILCLENIYNHMVHGGILYFNVPANSISHCAPFHFYTGFTPVGVGSLVETAGFKILSIGQWGNLEYLNKMFSTNSWPDYRQLRNPGLNDINCPVIIWVFAVKE